MKITNILNNYLCEKELKDLQALKDYCEEQGWVEDYYNILLPLYKEYGLEVIVNIGEIKWEWVKGGEYRVEYLNLDRLSTLVEWNEKKGKWVAVK